MEQCIPLDTFVRVINNGKTYTGFQVAARKMNLTKFVYEGELPCNGDTFKVVGHYKNGDGYIYGIRSYSGEVEHIVGAAGLEVVRLAKFDDSLFEV
jgi:hypothetical protein